MSASAAAVSQLTMSKEQADKMFKNTPDFKDYPSWTKDVDAINEQVPPPTSHAGGYLARGVGRFPGGRRRALAEEGDAGQVSQEARVPPRLAPCGEERGQRPVGRAALGVRQPTGGRSSLK